VLGKRVGGVEVQLLPALLLPRSPPSAGLPLCIAPTHPAEDPDGSVIQQHGQHGKVVPARVQLRWGWGSARGWRGAAAVGWVSYMSLVRFPLLDTPPRLDAAAGIPLCHPLQTHTHTHQQHLLLPCAPSPAPAKRSTHQYAKVSGVSSPIGLNTPISLGGVPMYSSLEPWISGGMLCE